jgi:N-acetylglucosaminyldiphosphoundecaprenol N-acetyl-beta-D-mannosaminyltransferase
MVGVGAAFEHLAGTKREAPRYLQRLGLEWAFRLATEPRRLWRRYLIGNVTFIRLLVQESISHVGRYRPRHGESLPRKERGDA